MNKYYKNKEVLITGGTGSLGKKLLKQFLALDVKGIRIFSRDELKQWELKNTLSEKELEKVAFILGDVRDEKRLKRAFQGVDIVVNAAAMKHVPACENDPIEAVKTNILGACNVINAALDCGVERVLHVSTDKAVYPINLYGATKTVAEKLFCDANIYRGGNYKTVFGCARYGNILGSRGSIIPFFNELYKQGKPLPITDKSMTRFFVPLDYIVSFLIKTIPVFKPGEIHIPTMKSVNIMELVKMLWPDAQTEIVGIRKGEKLHECLITAEEMVSCSFRFDSYILNTEQKPINLAITLTSLNNDEVLEKHDIPGEFYV
jgi:UDP-N-acetylglucosamine 4,6-dehydratase